MISKLKQMATKIFRIRHGINIYYSSEKQPTALFILDKDNQDLDYFAVEGGDAIHIRSS